MQYIMQSCILFLLTFRIPVTNNDDPFAILNNLEQ